jgi:hypothetical protein
MSISQVEAVPAAIGVQTSDDELTVSLADGRRISVPLVWFPRLLNATIDERLDFRLIGAGEGIHWPRVDEDISVATLLRGSGAQPFVRELTRNRNSFAHEFRRRENADTWHWCPQCSTYPTENYFVRRSKPDSGELCNECAARQR